MGKDTCKGMMTKTYAEAVSCPVPVANGNAIKTEKKSCLEGIHNQGRKGSIGISRKVNLPLVRPVEI